MHAQTAFNGNRQYVACPVTEELCDTVLALPMHPYMTETDEDIIAEKVNEFLGKGL